MSKEMRELLNKINAKKAEIKALVADGKIEDAASAKEELKKLQASFNILADLAIGAAAGSIIPGLGTAAGAAAGSRGQRTDRRK